MTNVHFYYDELDLTARKLEQDLEHPWYFSSPTQMLRWLPVLSSHAGIEVRHATDAFTDQAMDVFLIDRSVIELIGYQTPPGIMHLDAVTSLYWGVHIRGGTDYIPDIHSVSCGRRFSTMIIVVYDDDVHNLKAEIERRHPNTIEAEV